jgi:spermidine/putrescine transport system ATP-binding protein
LAVPDSSAPVASFQQAWKRFGEIVAARNLNFDVHSGEFLSFLGPSGCGKTTMLRMIAGFEQPTEGDVYLQGKRVNGVPAYQRPVNMVFQHYALFPHLDIAHNVAYGLKQAKPKLTQNVIDGRVDEALDLVQLGGYQQRRIWELSGGQQQRVALARALINKPLVLLLDEPLAALDRKLRREMQIELQNLQRNLGITFVLVTHDQEEALSMADRIGVMGDGVLLQVGTPEDIYDSPVNQFVADFIGRSNFLPGTVEAENLVCLSNGSRITVGHAGAVGDAVAVSLRPERVRMENLGEAPEDRPTLEGVVQSVTFLGNSIVYQIALDWLTIEARTENRPSVDRRDVGESVSIWWRDDAVAVVPG